MPFYTDMRRTGFFECGHEKVQKLYENQVWGQKSNYVEVPTDCPQRDERMGYTGDGQVFALTGAYNFDTNDFWKNLNDFRFIIPAGFLFSTRFPVRFLKKNQGVCARNFVYLAIFWASVYCITLALMTHFYISDFRGNTYEQQEKKRSA